MPHTGSYNRGPSLTSKLQVKSADNVARALNLRLAGWNYYDIAAELGVEPNTAQRYVKEAMDLVRFENAERADELRNVILLRNDALIESLIEKSLNGDLFATDRLIKIQQQSAELAGAFPKQRQEAKEDTNNLPVIILPEVLSPEEPQVIQGQLVAGATDDQFLEVQLSPVAEEVPVDAAAD